MRRNLVYASVVTGLAFHAFGQTLAFEVVSVKPNHSASNNSSSNSHNGVFTGTNQNLKSLIMRAYLVRDYQVTGPDWLASERFDIAAKPPAGAKDSDLGLMLQSMLAERFKLTLHHETRELPVYGVVVAKNGPKFKEVEDTGGTSTNSNRGNFVGERCSMPTFCAYLARHMDRPVIDMTNLTGVFNLTLHFMPDEGLPPRDDAKAGTEAYPPLLTALQEQLGLKMEPRKAPIDMLVVDHMDKVPSEN